MAIRTPVRSASDALLELLADWQRAMASLGVQALVVLGPDLYRGVNERRVLAVHPLDAQQAAYALARSTDFGEGPQRPAAPPVAWQPLGQPPRAPEDEVDAEWRRQWRERGAQTSVRVSFGLPAGRSIDVFMFISQALHQREQAASLAWQAQGMWPALKAALVAAWCPLTPREQECLRLAFDGLTARASAERMACTERTVNFHLANAMAKLGADNKMAAIQRACWLVAI